MENFIRIKQYTLDLPTLPKQIELIRESLYRLEIEHRDLLDKHAIDPNIFSNETATAEGLRHIYRYPLVQCGVKNGNAHITAIGQGAKALQLIMEKDQGLILHFRNRQSSKVGILLPEETYIPTTAPEGSHKYRVNTWMPFKMFRTNAEGKREPSFNEWRDTPYEIERLQILERKLNSNIITFCKAVSLHVPFTVKCRIISKHGEAWPMYNRRLQKTFDLTFETNIQLPEGIGIGGSVSEGFGRLMSPVNPKRALLQQRKAEQSNQSNAVFGNQMNN